VLARLAEQGVDVAVWLSTSPDMLVAPVTMPGNTATTSVWFPPGSSWTDYFTGKTYVGGTTQSVTTDLGTMPVFVRSGGIVTTRTGDVANDVQNPLTEVTVTVAGGASGATALYEDNGTTTDVKQSTSTPIRYLENGGVHQVQVGPATGGFAGQVTQRQWTVAFTNASAPRTAHRAPRTVTVNGHQVRSWSWNATTRTVTVTTPPQPTKRTLVVSYR
jgi:hypothetical protein